MFVYKITHLASGKAYVGITTGKVNRRIICHRADAKFGKPTAIARAIHKYGWAAFKVETLYQADSTAELLVCERALIAAHGTMAPRGYNLTSGGDGCNHRKMTPAQRAAISERVKKQHAEGRFPGRSPDWRPSVETREKMAAAKRGRKLTQEHKDKLALKSTGRKIPREAVERQVQKRRGAKRTPEQLARIRAGVRNSCNAKIDIDKARSIRAMAGTHEAIAGKFNISRSLVGSIKSGKLWKEN